MMMNKFQALIHDQSGQDLIEYALLCALVSIMAGAVILNFRYEMFGWIWSRVASTLDRI